MSNLVERQRKFPEPFVADPMQSFNTTCLCSIPGSDAHFGDPTPVGRYISQYIDSDTHRLEYRRRRQREQRQRRRTVCICTFRVFILTMKCIGIYGATGETGSKRGIGGLSGNTLWSVLRYVLWYVLQILQNQVQ